MEAYNNKRKQIGLPNSSTIHRSRLNSGDGRRFIISITIVPNHLQVSGALPVYPTIPDSLPTDNARMPEPAKLSLLLFAHLRLSTLSQLVLMIVSEMVIVKTSPFLRPVLTVPKITWKPILTVEEVSVMHANPPKVVYTILTV
jgi:hypothetical protein